MCKVSAVNSLKLPHDQLGYMAYDVIYVGRDYFGYAQKHFIEYTREDVAILAMVSGCGR